jgi:hypothetical protein
MKKAVLLLAVLLLGTTSWAQDSPIPDGLDYSVGGRRVTITGYSGNATFLAIPGEIQGLPVTAIGEFAFFNCSSLLSVTIPSSVTSISVLAFWGCISLTSIDIPYSGTSIGVMAFSYSSSLTSITVDKGNPAYASVDGVLFDKAIQTVIAYPAGRYETTYAIPSSVTSIGNSAFFGSYNLTSISIPSSVSSIEYAAFGQCISLISITIPYSVTSIAEGAFSGTSLASIAVDEMNPAYTNIEGVLFDKDIRTLIQYPNGKQAGTYAFPPSVIDIGDWAFAYSSSLSSMTIPSSIRSIGIGAFSNCDGLTDITIPPLEVIGTYMFAGCSSLVSINIPASVRVIGYQAFEGCSSLTSITIPSSVMDIGNEAFAGCSSLTSITLSRHTQLGERWFPASTRIVYRD